MAFHRLASRDELWEGELLVVNVRACSVILLKRGESIIAYENQCPHQGSRLTEGGFHEGTLTCPHHRWQFELATGLSLSPRGSRLKKLPVKVENGQILVDLDHYRDTHTSWS